jgi:hypothetical protein
MTAAATIRRKTSSGEWVAYDPADQLVPSLS